MGRVGLRKPYSDRLNAIMVNACVALAMGAAILVCPNPGMAADLPQPTKKDTPKAIKPKTAVLTAAVEPAEARAGDTVTFKVTAKLDPGYHIYKYSKTPVAGGPINTSFDFFDPADLKVEGDWTSSAAPEKHKDPNFPAIDAVEYHEDQVTWSITLKIPEGTAPGKKALLCQVGYMVCDAKNCSIPGRWTLPATTITVLPSDGKGPKAAVTAPDTQPKSLAPTPANEESKAAASDVPNNSALSDKKPAASLPSAPAIESEIAQKAQQGLIPFLIASAIGGSVRTCNALRLANGADHGQLFRQAGTGKGRKEQDDGTGDHLLSIDHWDLHGGRRPLLVLFLRVVPSDLGQ